MPRRRPTRQGLLTIAALPLSACRSLIGCSGRVAAIAQQTVAGARYGAIVAGWGDKRTERLERLIHRSRPLPVDDATVWAFARLRAQCRVEGHPLHQKDHIGDLWIAATAIRWELPLVAHDRVFLQGPRVDLRTELT